VQIPEGCEEDGAAYKAGLRTIADIAKERIRRAGAKIKAESAITAPDLDVGFRVLKIDTSNMKDVYYAPDAIKQADLLAHLDNIREDRTPEDLLFQVLVDWGVDLALPIATESLAGKTVFFVDGNALAACFDTDINEDLVKELARRKPLTRRLSRQQLWQRQRQNQRGADLQASQPEHGNQVALSHETQIQTTGLPDRGRHGGCRLLRRPASSERHHLQDRPRPGGRGHRADTHRC
jgi:hypothetical protein